MIKLKHFLFLIVITNVIFLFLYYQQAEKVFEEAGLGMGADGEDAFKEQPEQFLANKKPEKQGPRQTDNTITKKPAKTIPKAPQRTSNKVIKDQVFQQWKKMKFNTTGLQERWSHLITDIEKISPFKILDASAGIEEKYLNAFPYQKTDYSSSTSQLIKDYEYCSMVDLYNLLHRDNIFEKVNIFNDHAYNSFVRQEVIHILGNDTMPEIAVEGSDSEHNGENSNEASDRDFIGKKSEFPPEINIFFSENSDLHIQQKYGKTFSCATQLYNQVPGDGALKRNDLFIEHMNQYAEQFTNKSQCFDKNKFFPKSYRLFMEDECIKFFKILNTSEYQKRKRDEGIQFVIKSGYDLDNSQGPILLTDGETYLLRQKYGENGKNCGKITQPSIAQTYIGKPILLDHNNKFKFRTHLLIASTNPYMVYYNEGFIRASLVGYDQFSHDRVVHLTCTHLSKRIFDSLLASPFGMTSEELKEYQIWTLEELQEYLLESNKTQDKELINNKIRPKLKEGFSHLSRIAEKSLLKESNLFEVFEVDFIMDDQYQLWFMKVNENPMFYGQNPTSKQRLSKMLQDAFEIQINLYRSRMKRVFALIDEMYNEMRTAKEGKMNFAKYRKKYLEANKNHFEPEYTISETNSFIPIIDRTKKGKDAYCGIISEECI